jgi:DNA-binding NarL/FixJ family response regulator
MNQPIRILLVDDSPHFIETNRDFLSFQERLTVVGTATNMKEAAFPTATLEPGADDFICKKTMNRALLPAIRGQIERDRNNRPHADPTNS